MSETHWSARGACRKEGVDPEWFWPVSDEGHSRSAALALHICRSHCEVRWVCDEEEAPKVRHPQVVGGRRYTTANGSSHGESRKLAESRLTKPSSAGCPLCGVS